MLANNKIAHKIAQISYKIMLFKNTMKQVHRKTL